MNTAIFVNDDKIATASDDQTVKLWDLRIMRSPVCTINVNSGVNRICSINLNANGGGETGGDNTVYLGLPLDNRDVKVYNLNGERMLRLARNDRVGHRRLVTCLASYGNLLFSSSFDKLINCWSIDSNPTKSSTTSASSANKLTSSNNSTTTNNKENSNEHNNSHIDQSQTTGSAINNKSLDNGSWHSNLFRSTSPTTSTSQLTTTTSPVLTNSNPQQQQPLNIISQNNTKGINSLSKLAERIKI